MIHLFAIKDIAIESHGRIVQVQHRNEAIRMFKDEANREDSQIGKHPEDFELWYIGIYNETDASIEPIKPIERVARALDMVEVAK